MLALVAGLALAAVDPCAPVTPAPAADPAAAAEYRAVAEGELAAGERETAVIAWRKAAALDPSDAAARGALARLCREGPSTRSVRDPMTEAIGLFDAGHYREAAERLRALQRGGASGDAALLEGICRYELGEDAEAARLLRLAEADPDHRDTARLYLGLVTLREGSPREAAALFDAAAANPAVASFATDLARAARWNGPLLVSLLAEGGYDSNVSLTSGRVGPMTTGDAVGALSALVLARPFGPNGLYLRAGGTVSQYARLTGYDLALFEGAGGWRWWRGNEGLSAEYAFADRTLDGNAYLVTHRLLASGAIGLGPFTLGAAWQGRWERFAQTWSGYSGFAQRADGRLSLPLGPALRLGAGWTWGHDDTDARALAWQENGPRADLRLALAPRTRLVAEVGGVVRRYEQADVALGGVRQRDVIVDGTAAVEHDLGPRTTLRLSLLVRKSSSNVAGFDYTKVVPTGGIGVVWAP